MMTLQTYIATVVPLSALVDPLLVGAVAWWIVRRRRRKLLAELARDDRGVGAIEFAILAPVFITLVGGALDVAQFQNARSGLAFALGASASVGGRTLSKGGVSAALTAAQTAWTANVPAAFYLGSVGTLDRCEALDKSGSVTTDDAAATSLRCSGTVTAKPLFPIPTLSIYNKTMSVQS